MTVYDKWVGFGLSADHLVTDGEMAKQQSNEILSVRSLRISCRRQKRAKNYLP